MALTLRYFTEFDKPAFQLITASTRIELIDQKSASITHRAAQCARITKSKDFSVLSIYRLSFALFSLCFDFSLF